MLQRFSEIDKGNMVRFRLERGDKPRFGERARTCDNAVKNRLLFVDARLRLPSALVEAIGVCWRFSSKVCAEAAIRALACFDSLVCIYV
jgi:hypothetical protein